MIDRLSTVQKELRKASDSSDFTDIGKEAKNLANTFKTVGKGFEFKGSRKELDSEIAKYEKVDRIGRI